MDNETRTDDFPPVPPEAPAQAHLEIMGAPDYKPVFTYLILGLTIFIYLLQMGTLYLQGIDIPASIGAKVNEAILAGQWWRLFTPMLLHDDRLPIHILSNMYFLAVVGARLEKFTGHRRFLLLYITAGFAGNVFSFLFSPYAAWGASTALFGLMGAQVIFILQNRRFLNQNGRGALQNILTLIVVNVLIGFMIGADNWGHIGGLLGGLAFAWFGGPKLTLEEIAHPRYRLVDLHGLREQLLATGLVAAVFGGYAALKIIGIAF